jgi:hypothetical protein
MVFAKQSALELAFSIGRNFRPEKPGISVDSFGPSLLTREFTVGQIARVATSQLLILVSHLSVIFLWVSLRIVLVTQLTAALHVGFLASRHNFLSLSLSCRR